MVKRNGSDSGQWIDGLTNVCNQPGNIALNIETRDRWEGMCP